MVDGAVGGLMDGWTEGREDQRIDRWVEGQMD